jgi:hypothetical protein
MSQCAVYKLRDDIMALLVDEGECSFRVRIFLAERLFPELESSLLPQESQQE